MFFRSVISAIMILIQLTVMNVGFGLKGTDSTAEEPPSEIVNDISSDEMADTIKYAADCYNSVQGCYENGGYDRYTLENEYKRDLAKGIHATGKASASMIRTAIRIMNTAAMFTILIQIQKNMFQTNPSHRAVSILQSSAVTITKLISVI